MYAPSQTGRPSDHTSSSLTNLMLSMARQYPWPAASTSFVLGLVLGRWLTRKG